MNTNYLKKTSFLLLLMGFAFSFSSNAQIAGWNVDLEKDSNEKLAEMIQKVGKLQSFKDKAYGYAIYPKITKAGLVIGGAGGKGLVYKGKQIVASSKLGQASFGLQAGGQQYAEVIFFENQEAFDRFKSGKLKFNAQASATAITEGASADFSYQDGVAVFTMVAGGLMAEASVGGQHFSFDPVQ
ncbi:MAG: lipid-binding SYLF domain-containing protein [Eudoraea sp.]|uniref:lipid-binding SYLF domain-containing protein n=1 Tax=Eudoraea sp. TaxID=1979955 RepID=UPI003C754BC9